MCCAGSGWAHGVRESARSTGVHRTVVRERRELSAEKGWLDAEGEVPTEEQIQTARAAASREQLLSNRLNIFQEEVGRWVKDGYSYIVMEVDFAHLGISYDPESRRNRRTYVFSARLRQSRLARRERVFDQKQQTFFVCHIHAFEYFGGVSARVTPDNLKPAVVKASFEEPIVNRAYRQMAEHYGFLIDPCLPYRPEHKDHASDCTL